MFATVLADDAFVMENAASLKRYGEMQLSHSRSVCSPAFCGVYSGHSSDYYCVFNHPGLFCFVLCLVFEQAIRCKQGKMTLTI